MDPAVRVEAKRLGALENRVVVVRHPVTPHEFALGLHQQAMRHIDLLTVAVTYSIPGDGHLYVEDGPLVIGERNGLMRIPQLSPLDKARLWLGLLVVGRWTAANYGVPKSFLVRVGERPPKILSGPFIEWYRTVEL